MERGPISLSYKNEGRGMRRRLHYGRLQVRIKNAGKQHIEGLNQQEQGIQDRSLTGSLEVSCQWRHRSRWQALFSYSSIGKWTFEALTAMDSTLDFQNIAAVSLDRTLASPPMQLLGLTVSRHPLRPLLLRHLSRHLMALCRE